MTRAKDISKIVTDANLSGTLDVTGAFTSQGIDDNADATAITITSAEKVGLGIDPSTLPSFISHAMKIVNGGGLSITSPSSSDNRYIFFGTGTSSSDVQLAAIKNSSSELMFLGASGAERMRINSSGNVGIGTSSISSSDKLSINGGHARVVNSVAQSGNTLDNSTFSGLIVNNSNDANGDLAGIVMYPTSQYTAAAGVFGVRESQTAAGISFWSGSNTGSERMRIDSAGRVGIGVVPTAQFSHNILQIGNQATLGANASLSTTGQTYLTHNLYYDTGGTLRVYNTGSANEGALLQMVDGQLKFSNSSATTGTPTVTERMRVHSGGAISVGTTETNVMTVDGRHGIVFHNNTVNAYAGVAQFSANGSAGIRVNRDADDGNLVIFRQNATQEGTISVSSNTVSYNAFSGSHWSRLSDNSNPTILAGTIIETIDEMMDWYQAEFQIQEEGETRTARESIALASDTSVGDTLTVSFEGNDYTATIVKEADNKHTKCKISDTADSTRVYGVFAGWDNDDDNVNDMYVTAVGTHVVRVHSSATISAGDLLVSNGDGTAKLQDDDIIRSKTIGKVLTNIVQETYDDGSYTVPCALYCG